tara:strand:- start:300 stop:1109 length:810 start_codon:yes stop_codon:yes gene_type:complete
MSKKKSEKKFARFGLSLQRYPTSRSEVINYAIEGLQYTDYALEVGTFYCGWTSRLSKKFGQVLTIQSPLEQHTKNQELGFELMISNIRKIGGRSAVSYDSANLDYLPDEDKKKYNFNILAKELSSIPKKNVMCLLSPSPLPFDIGYRFDFCSIDLGRSPKINMQQLKYWKQFARRGARILLCAYNPIDFHKYNIDLPNDDLSLSNKDLEYKVTNIVKTDTHLAKKWNSIRNKKAIGPLIIKWRWLDNIDGNYERITSGKKKCYMVLEFF